MEDRTYLDSYKETYKVISLCFLVLFYAVAIFTLDLSILRHFASGYSLSYSQRRFLYFQSIKTERKLIEMVFLGWNKRLIDKYIDCP